MRLPHKAFALSRKISQSSDAMLGVLGGGCELIYSASSLTIKNGAVALAKSPLLLDEKYAHLLHSMQEETRAATFSHALCALLTLAGVPSQ
jgi:hypothetical protein